VVEHGKAAASDLLEAAVADIEFGNGRFTIAGTDRSIGVLELAASLLAASSCPTTRRRARCQIASDRCRPHSRTVADVAEVESIRKPRGRGGEAFLRQRFRHRHHPMLVEGRCMAVSSRASPGADGKRRLRWRRQPITARSWTTPCARCRCASFVTEHHPVPATPIRSASRAAARPAAPPLVAVPNAIIDALSDYGIPTSTCR